jgi:small-conductance mechanosensitive channel
VDIGHIFLNFWNLASGGKLAFPIWNAIFWLVVLLIRRPVTQGCARLLGVTDKALGQAISKETDLAFVLMVLDFVLVPFAAAFEDAAGLAMVVAGGRILAVVLILYMFIHTLDLIVFRWYFTQRRAMAVPNVMRFFVLTVLYVLAFLLLLDWGFGVSVLPLLATSTVLGAVLGLALQNTLKNLFAGLTLSLEKTFREGDWVNFRVDANTSWIGQIVEIGWRSTKLRTMDNTYAVIPNFNFTSNFLLKLTPPNNEQAKVLLFPVSLGADQKKVREALQAAALSSSDVLKEPPPQALPAEVQADKVVYQLRFWFSSYEHVERVSGEIIENAVDRLTGLNALPH